MTFGMWLILSGIGAVFAILAGVVVVALNWKLEVTPGRDHHPPEGR